MLVWAVTKFLKIFGTVLSRGQAPASAAELEGYTELAKSFMLSTLQ